jgi:hypothetical protein
MAAHRIGGMVIAEPNLIEKIWPQVWGAIGKSVTDFGLEDEQAVKSRLLRAEGFLIIVGDAIAVVRQAGKFFEITYVGGKNVKKHWGKLSEHIDAMAKAFKCEKVLSFGRPAWAKIASDYKMTQMRMYEKEVICQAQ